jgi:hypothetical protein
LISCFISLFNHSLLSTNYCIHLIDITDEETSLINAGEEADIIAKSINVAIKGNERMKKKQEVLDFGKTKRIFHEVITSSFPLHHTYRSSY